MTKKSPLALIILDGWGIRKETKKNAIAQAHTPNFDALWKQFPHTQLDASAKAVGLPEGQMGNSEIGHMTIGSGTILDTDLARINKAIEKNEFFTNQAFVELFDHIKKHNSTLHIQGLLSPGGIHSHTKHLYAFLHSAKQHNITKIALHTFIDGRDASPTSGATYLEELEDILDDIGIGHIVSASGRYYAMDRDNNWDRIEKVEKTLFEGIAPKEYQSVRPSAVVKKLYQEGVFDEHIEPTVFLDSSQRRYPIQENDGIFFFNFRPDRARQLSKRIIEHSQNKNICFVTLTQYDESLPSLVAFPPERPQTTLAKVLSENGYSQAHIAETEKFAHATYFLNGGKELPHKKERHILVESRRDIKTHDEAPEMKAKEITDMAIKEIEKGTDFLFINYANADMVGHTGNFQAIIQSLEILDKELGRLVEALHKKNGSLFITSDHGNAEQNFDEATKEIHTQHTTNPVPAIFTNTKIPLKKGSLADITPTLLDFLHIPIPISMKGKSLLKK
jgi:2,3-bisphosphoglycerate-independent phosphoglycerate mutase